MSAMTFWTLISENRIEIPIIQRDYTYGRPENKPLAQRFVDTLAESILAPTGNPRQSLNLDFVYGTVVSKNGSNILYPIDGQQRLTTLFLLHFYLAAKESRLAEIGQTLSRFTYETRLNSRDFCNLLVNASISFEQSGGRPRDLIGEYPWYSKRWDRDPTVHSMMEVLDLLHDRLKGSNGKYLDKLLDATSSPITFSFIDLNRESLTDDLYVKMNARGKPLNEFENLKAQIFRHMKDLETRAHFDNQWLDIFWQLSRNSNIEERSVLAEQKFGRFIGNMIINMSAQKGNRWHAETFDIFQAMKDIFSDDSHVNEFRKILDTLSDRETFGMTEEFLTAFAQPDLTYWDRVRFYAVCQFFLAFGPVSDEHQAAFSRWKRVTKNLINNTLIQRPENFRDAITSIKELSAHIENIYEYLASTKVNIRFFVTEQREEESLKAKLIVADPEWESLIHKAESNAYFDGQIGFILAIATEQGRGPSKNLFSRYLDILSQVFPRPKNDSEYLFERALLSLSDYCVSRGNGFFSLCVGDMALRAKIDNWRTVFNDDGKRAALRQLLDMLDDQSVSDSLRAIITNSKANDWRRFLIREPSLFAYSTERIVQKFSAKKIYIMSKKRVTSWHKELTTGFLYYSLQNGGVTSPFEAISYEDSKSQNEEPFLLLKDWDVQGVKRSLKISLDADEDYCRLELLNVQSASPDIGAIHQAGFDAEWVCKLSAARIAEDLDIVLQRLEGVSLSN